MSPSDGFEREVLGYQLALSLSNRTGTRWVPEKPTDRSCECGRVAERREGDVLARLQLDSWEVVVPHGCDNRYFSEHRLQARCSEPEPL